MKLEDLLNTIYDNIDLVDLIKADMNLRLHGSVYMGGAPGWLNGDPSFIVDPRAQTWRDLDKPNVQSEGPTGAGGDCIDYVKRRDGGEYVDALRSLAHELGLDPPWDELSGELSGWADQRMVEEFLTWASVCYYVQVSAFRSKDREDIASDLGVSFETFNRITIGRSDGSLYEDVEWMFGQAAQDLALRTGLLAKDKDDSFREVLGGRYTFPCWCRGRAARIVGYDLYHDSISPEVPFIVSRTRDQRHPDVSEHVNRNVLFGEDSLLEGEEIVIAPDVVTASSLIEVGVSCVAPPGGALEPGHRSRLVKLGGEVPRLVFYGAPPVLELARAVRLAGGQVNVASSDDAVGIEAAVNYAMPISRYIGLPDRLPGQEEEVDEGEDGAPPFRGAVVERDGRYHSAARNGALTAISSFLIRPKRRIVVDDEEEIIEGDVVCDNGRTYENVQLPPRAFESQRGLQRLLRKPDLQWTGTAANLQGVLRLLSGANVPTVVGTKNLGYLEAPPGSRWVTPQGVLFPEGEAENDEIIYLGTGSSLAKRIDYSSVAPSIVEKTAKAILPRLLELNAPAVVVPTIAWFFTSPLRPRIQRLLGGFPSLFVWGTQGSGKSSIIIDVFWPMLGVVESSPFSCTDTEAALVERLNSTSSIPIFLDEYKPSDMPQGKLELLHRYVRRLYKWEAVERGQRGGGVTFKTLRAPLCLAGETRPTEPAVVERLLVMTLSKTELQDETRRSAFKAVKDAKPHLLAASIIRWLLAQDTEADLDQARSDVDQLIGSRELPPRVRDHLLVLGLGLLHFTRYAASLGVTLPEIDIGAAIDVMLEELLEGDRGVKSALDFFVEKLSVLAAQGEVKKGTHYVFNDNDILAIHLTNCHAVYTEKWRRHDGGERLDKKAISRLLREDMNSNGYVKDTQGYGKFNKGRMRAVLIDFEKASEKLEIDGFEKDASVLTGGGN